MATRSSRRSPLWLPAILAILMLPAHAGAQGQPRLNNKKVDRALREAVAAGSTESQRVIIRTKPGYRLTLRQALQAHGDAITNDHPSISALSAEVRSRGHRGAGEVHRHPVGVGRRHRDRGWEGSGRLAFRGECEVHCEEDRHPGGAVGHADERAGLAAGSQGTRTRCARRSAWCSIPKRGQRGEGIVVAVIDSGIAPIADLRSQIVGFVDFTQGGVASTRTTTTATGPMCRVSLPAVRAAWRLAPH